ncbi:MAG: class I fructose-bisphosphate aldolase [Candidatus Latescibacterota bacterium]|nr:class I fructose-bisphosphate aldolase [Candidatus Latescibacterota bacterium]
MNTTKLVETAQAMVAPGKGILAADEGSATAQQRFDSIKVPCTEDNRRAYRELLLTTPGMEEFISGVILFDETVRQSTSEGLPFPELLAGKGVVPGIKVDTGPHPLAGFPGETVTEGLDGLRDQVGEYVSLGARFAKWRAVIRVDEQAGVPSHTCIDTNAHALARYAAICQEVGLVPIVEPEVLMEGSHDLCSCEAITEQVLRHVFAVLGEHRVLLEGIILKPSMVIPGKQSPNLATVEQVAEATVRCFRRTVPAAVPGIAFLSGGQSPEEATAHLSAMNVLGDVPWELSFSYGRALQAPVLKAWSGKAENAEAAQRAFHLRAQLNSSARTGLYRADMESAEAA